MGKMMLRNALMALGIGGVSTGFYYVFTKDERNPHKVRTNECICVFTIIVIVAFLMLFIASGSQSVVVRDGGTKSLGHKPPF
jgi:hypothetical protein